MPVEFFWKIIQKSWGFSLSPLSILFAAFHGRRIELGFWVNVLTDRIPDSKTLNSSENDSLEIYQYSPLKHSDDIRLLEIAPGRYSSPLRGHLIYNEHIPAGAESLKWAREYEALSYVWGDPRSWKLMLLDEKQFFITQNLDTALRHLRDETKPVTLWVDAICINQNDDSEKSCQVRNMLHVYAEAKNVMIWLGPSRGCSDKGIEALRYLAHSTFRRPAPWLTENADRIREGLTEVLGRVWFKRIWVVQEAAVSQKATMICGYDSFSWTNEPVKIRRFMRMIKAAAISPQWEFANLSRIEMDEFLQLLELQLRHIERVRRESFQKSPDILDVAYDTRHRQCTDPRDRLYAVMGLVDSADSKMFVPDYNLPVGETFQHMLRSVEI